MPKALITGITGQDGSYLSELLLEKGYEVHGIIRRVAIEDPTHHMSRIQHIADDLVLHPASMESFPSIYSVVRSVEPDECYHLAAQSFVATSFQDAFSTLNTNINGTHYILAALHDLQPDCRYYFAGSSEMFGKVAEVPQTEITRFHPRSPYGISKVAGYDLTRNYREAYEMHASSGILFNHESPRRGFEFVTRKITSHVARIKLGQLDHVSIGNLDSKRDWGHSREYVRAMWMMLQQDVADDYVIATGETHSIRELCELAFSHVDLNWEDYVRIDERFLRPAEVDLLVGDATKAREQLKWENEVTFEGLIREMVDADLELYGKNPNPRGVTG